MSTWNMGMRVFLLAVGISGTAHAALQDRGGGLIYDTDLNITWLQNPSLQSMTWDQALAWVDNLSYFDSVRNVFYTDWRLPAFTDTGTLGCDYEYSGSDCGYNVDTSTGELAHLFYDELGNKSYFSPTGEGAQAGWGPVNQGPFSTPNPLPYYYWYDSEYAPYTDGAWAFNFNSGLQGGLVKDGVGWTWAVRTGDVAAIPEAQTYALMLAGLVLVSAAARRRKQTNI